MNNREIKFRVWDKKRKEMSCGDWNITFNCKSHDYPVTIHGIDRDNKEDFDFEIQQFTGLKDKNGKEIYEGDLIKTDPNHIAILLKANDCVEYSCGEIMFSNEAWKIGQCKIGASYLGDYAMCDCCPSAIEIIGNIFENPELI